VTGRTSIVYEDEGVGKFIDKLRMSFDVEKSITSDPNKATIQIYNLNNDSIENIKKDDLITFRAGYDPGVVLMPGGAELPIVYRGNISFVESGRRGPDRITTIECGDTSSGLGVANVTWAADTPIEDAFNKAKETFENLATEVQESFGSILSLIVNRATSHISSEPETATPNFLNGFSFKGKMRDMLDNISDKTSTDWSIQDNKLQLVPRDGWLDDVFIMRQGSGLIEEPKKTENGWLIRSLLRADMLVGARMELESSTANGLFKIVKLNHTGDNFEGQWQTSAEVVE
jgi:hypothetical protein